MKGGSTFCTDPSPSPILDSVPQRPPRPAGTPRTMSSSRSTHRLRARSTPAASAWRSRKTARWVARVGRGGHRHKWACPSPDLTEACPQGQLVMCAGAGRALEGLPICILPLLDSKRQRESPLYDPVLACLLALRTVPIKLLH